MIGLATLNPITARAKVKPKTSIRRLKNNKEEARIDYEPSTLMNMMTQSMLWRNEETTRQFLLRNKLLNQEEI